MALLTWALSTCRGWQGIGIIKEGHDEKKKKKRDMMIINRVSYVKTKDR